MRLQVNAYGVSRHGCHLPSGTAPPLHYTDASIAPIAEQQYLRYDAPPRLIVASTVRRCEGPGARVANRLNWASVANKLDYAHLHGFEFWLHAEQVPAQQISFGESACVEYA